MEVNLGMKLLVSLWTICWIKLQVRIQNLLWTKLQIKIQSCRCNLLIHSSSVSVHVSKVVSGNSVLVDKTTSSVTESIRAGSEVATGIAKNTVTVERVTSSYGEATSTEFDNIKGKVAQNQQIFITCRKRERAVLLVEWCLIQPTKIMIIGTFCKSFGDGFVLRNKVDWRLQTYLE